MLRFRAVKRRRPVRRLGATMRHRSANGTFPLCSPYARAPHSRLALLAVATAVGTAAAAGCASPQRTPDRPGQYSVILLLASADGPIGGTTVGGTDSGVGAASRGEVAETLRSMGFTDVRVDGRRANNRDGRGGALVRARTSSETEPPNERRDGALAVLSAAAIDSSAGALRRELALFQLHRAIADGATGGVVLDCGGGRTESECLAPLDSAALHRVLDRARAWGGALSGTRPAPLPKGWSVPPGMKAVRLVGPSRELLFVRNSSMTRFARGVVSLPAAGGGGFSRAMELMPSPSSPAGRVVRAKEGRIDIEIELALRPADAALFRLR